MLSSSSREIEHSIPVLSASIRRVIVVRTSFRGAPRRIIFNASSTASLGRVCAMDGDFGSAFSLDDALVFAINQQPFSRKTRSIAQTNVRHFADQRGYAIPANRLFVRWPSSSCQILRLAAWG